MRRETTISSPLQVGKVTKPLTALMQEILDTVRNNDLVFMSGLEIGKLIGRPAQHLGAALGGLKERGLVCCHRLPIIPFQVLWCPYVRPHGMHLLTKKMHYAVPEKKEYFKEFINLRWTCAKQYKEPQR